MFAGWQFAVGELVRVYGPKGKKMSFPKQDCQQEGCTMRPNGLVRPCTGFQSATLPMCLCWKKILRETVGWIPCSNEVLGVATINPVSTCPATAQIEHNPTAPYPKGAPDDAYRGSSLKHLAGSLLVPESDPGGIKPTSGLCGLQLSFLRDEEIREGTVYCRSLSL